MLRKLRDSTFWFISMLCLAHKDKICTRIVQREKFDGMWCILNQCKLLFLILLLPLLWKIAATELLFLHIVLYLHGVEK